MNKVYAKPVSLVEGTYKKAEFIIKPFHKCNDVFNVLVDRIVHLSYEGVHELALSLHIRFYLLKREIIEPKLLRQIGSNIVKQTVFVSNYKTY